MGRVSGMEIFPPKGWKNLQKLARGRQVFPSHGLFFNPREEEISITETHGSFENCIPVGVNQEFFCFLLSSDKFFDVRAKKTKKYWRQIYSFIYTVRAPS